MNSKTTKSSGGKTRTNDCMENCSDNVTKKGSTSTAKNCSSCGKRSVKSDK